MLRVAPLSVAGLLRSRLFDTATAVLTSATLTIGGSFEAMAGAWGLGRRDPAGRAWTSGPRSNTPSPASSTSPRTCHRRAATAAGSAEQLDEIAGLIEAAGGRTLGLFSSMRAARAAAESMRARLDTPVLCQGDDGTAALVERFAADPETSLFGTLSLWQGVDVPGPSLSLVLIDRIPFPRPDDPLLTARQRAVSPGAATGSWRSRPATPRCCSPRARAGCCGVPTTAAWSPCSIPGWPPPATAGILRASLPPFWTTTDPAAVKEALQRLRAPAAR